MIKKRVKCLNCGEKGHRRRECHQPINSYGCIVYKKEDNIIRYLLIQRKYSPEYIELLRGHYYIGNEVNYQYLILLIKEIPLIERNYIMKYDFDYLWSHIWQWTGTDKQTSQIRRDCDLSRTKFENLKKGFQFKPSIGCDGISQHDELMIFVSFQELFKTHPTNKIEPDWEFPKGKRHKNESDQLCAIRECCEETSLNSSDFKVLFHITPLREIFNGVNNITYCHTYYLAILNNSNKHIYYDPSHTEQNKEIRKIGWFTKPEIQQLMMSERLLNNREVMNNCIHSLVSEEPIDISNHPYTSRIAIRLDFLDQLDGLMTRSLIGQI